MLTMRLLPLILLLLNVRPGVAQSKAEIKHPVVDSITRELIGKRTPALAVLVVRNGQVLHRSADGYTTVDNGTAADTRTPFYIASVAKMFTAAAVLILAEDGGIDLDTPIRRYLPESRIYLRDVTVGQLLTHTSGLVDHYKVGGSERTYSNTDVLDILRADSLRFEPGTRAAYSNSGYVLLALLVERVTGKPFAAFLRERLFEPLGMRDAVVVTRSTDRPHRRALGHRSASDGFSPYDYNSTTTGAGGIYASLSDLEQWFSALRDGQVLSQRSLALMSRPPVLTSGKLTPYGMGWLAEFAARGPLANRWYVLAMGSLRGHRAWFQWYQEGDLLVAWLANAADGTIVEAFQTLPALLLSPDADGQ